MVMKWIVTCSMLMHASKGGIGSFHGSQIPLLEADLKLARENGYVVLLFYHIPISTGKPEDKQVKARLKGDLNASVRNFYDNCIGASSEGASGEIYRLITSNADIIKGAFSGHHHSDFHTEISGTTAEGFSMSIPQYCIADVPYFSNAMRITVK